MADNKIPDEARALMKSAELATQQLLTELKPSWLDKILAYLKYKKDLQHKLEIQRHADDQCARGHHKASRWVLTRTVTVFSNGPSNGRPLGNRYIYGSQCSSCKAPMIRVLNEFEGG